MNRARTFNRLLAALLWSAFIAIAAQAQGIIVPEPCPRCPRPILPPPEWRPPAALRVKSIRFTAKINDQVAVTHVEQIFANDSPYTLEGTYFFPLPDGVSITEFAMWDGDRRLVGEVRSRDEARRIYNEIVRSRRDPALLEYAGRNLFQASVFPIAPHSDKKIELTYSRILPNEGGTVAYRYPLGTGWRAQAVAPPIWSPRPVPRPMPPRREPDMPRPLPDEGEAQPGRSYPPPPGSVSAEIEITSRTALKSIYSPSHELAVKRDGERRARVSFETRATSSQPDFQLFYTLSNEDFGLSLLTHREPGKDGYFALLVAPKAELDEREVSAREVVFVIDTSGSMSEEGKMDKAKAALRYGVNALGARDRFNIVSFSGEEHLLAEGLLAADEAGKRRANEFIERMRAAGGTNINDALLAAFKQIQPSERPQMVVLLTDGQPTVGITQAGKIMANAKDANRTNARLFTFGVGYDVNTLLLDALANEQRGAVAYIEPKEDIEVKVSNFFAKVNHPVLSELKIDWGGVQTELVYPRATPDIFHGSQLVLVGRYHSPRTARLTLSGKVNGRERRFIYDDLKFTDGPTTNEFLPHLWAMRRVGQLLDQIRLNGESKELRDEIVDLGTRYGIVTPYTSALVLEPGMRPGIAVSGGPMRQAGGGRRANSTADAVTVAPTAPPPKPSPPPAAGKDAVLASKQKEVLRNAETVARQEQPNDQIRRVAGKTFYLRAGVWTDSEFKAEAKLAEIKLKFAGDGYFELINREPKLAEFFALGQNVVVVWNGKVYRVTE